MAVFLLVYMLISLPAMFGYSYVIDWVDEVTFQEKFQAYVIGGLAENWQMKILLSSIVGVVFALVMKKRM